MVSWALERKCAFRSGEQRFLPARTCTQLADLRTVAAAEGDGRVVNGICVTSWTTERDNAGSAWLDGEEKEAFRVVQGGWCSATEFVCTSSARRQLRADAGSRDDEGEGQEGVDGGPMASLFAMMYTPYGFRVVCECP